MISGWVDVDVGERSSLGRSDIVNLDVSRFGSHISAITFKNMPENRSNKHQPRPRKYLHCFHLSSHRRGDYKIKQLILSNNLNICLLDSKII